MCYMISNDYPTQIQELVERHIASESASGAGNPFLVPAGVSNRHIHLCRKDLDTLFGPGYELQPMKALYQKNDFAAKETLVVAGPKGAISKVRILGPLRTYTQLEVLISDGYTLGIKPPIRDSGSREPSPTLTLIGPAGSVTLNAGVLAAWRHLHLGASDAARIGVRDGEMIQIRVPGERGLILDHVKVRVGAFIPEFHIDVDEANAALVKTGDKLEVIKPV